MRSAVRCEAEDLTGQVTRLGEGVGAVGIWLHLKVEKEYVSLPDYYWKIGNWNMFIARLREVLSL